MNSSLTRRDILVGATSATLAIGLASKAISNDAEESDKRLYDTTPFQGGFDPIVIGPSKVDTSTTGQRIVVDIYKPDDISEYDVYNVRVLTLDIKKTGSTIVYTPNYKDIDGIVNNYAYDGSKYTEFYEDIKFTAGSKYESVTIYLTKLTGPNHQVLIGVYGPEGCDRSGHFSVELET
jgi:hypothetical protein